MSSLTNDEIHFPSPTLHNNNSPSEKENNWDDYPVYLERYRQKKAMVGFRDH